MFGTPPSDLQDAAAQAAYRPMISLTDPSMSTGTAHQRSAWILSLTEAVHGGHLCINASFVQLFPGLHFVKENRACRGTWVILQNVFSLHNDKDNTH